MGACDEGSCEEYQEYELWCEGKAGRAVGGHSPPSSSTTVFLVT